MEQVSGYGNGLGSRLRAQATTFVCPLPNTRIAVTELRSDNPETGISTPLVREDAFLIALHLVGQPTHEYFEDHGAAPISSLRAGDTTLHDLKRGPQFMINRTFHGVYFYFPRSALNLITDRAGEPRIEELSYEPGVGATDPIVRAVAGSLMPAFAQPEQASRHFVEHVILAVGAHAAKTYGSSQPSAFPFRGGLAGWQVQRAKEMLSAASRDEDVSIDDLASNCGLSASHFSRAFRQSTGVSPHQWRLQHRVDRAKSLLRDQKRSLAEVALACGFSDQSHFNRIFVRLAGISPGAWRRSLEPAAAFRC